MDDETMRFTLILPTKVVEALDAHCKDQERRAASVLKAKVEVGRSKAIEAILREKFKVPATD